MIFKVWHRDFVISQTNLFHVKLCKETNLKSKIFDCLWHIRFDSNTHSHACVRWTLLSIKQDPLGYLEANVSQFIA